MLFLLQLFGVALWLALVYWTFQDSRRRVHTPALIAVCVALSLFMPYLGSVIYLIVRPPEYLDEARERELELLALEQRLGDLGDAEGQQIVGRLLAREGVASSDNGGMQRALRQAGVALSDDVKDLDTRLTELEFRLRAGAGAAPATAASPRRRRGLTEGAGREVGDTGRDGS